jgi:hypothetical protein
MERSSLFVKKNYTVVRYLNIHQLKTEQCNSLKTEAKTNMSAGMRLERVVLPQRLSAESHAFTGHLLGPSIYVLGLGEVLLGSFSDAFTVHGSFS